MPTNAFSQQRSILSKPKICKPPPPPPPPPPTFACPPATIAFELRMKSGGTWYYGNVTAAKTGTGPWTYAGPSADNKWWANLDLTQSPPTFDMWVEHTVLPMGYAEIFNVSYTWCTPQTIVILDSNWDFKDPGSRIWETVVTW